MFSTNSLRRHMMSNTSTAKPNVKYATLVCNKCRQLHFYPPDCPVAPVCPRCLYAGQTESTMKHTPTITVAAAIGWVLIAVLAGYVIGYGRH